MSKVFVKLEFDDSLGANKVLDNENRGVKLTLRRFNASQLEYRVRNVGNINDEIIFGNEVRVYADFGTNPPTTRRYTGINLEHESLGTYRKTLNVLSRDLFKDRRLTKDINKKYPDQEVKITAEDIVTNFMGGGFTTAGMETLGISQPYNFVAEGVDHALTRITESSFSELFMKPNKDVVLRPLKTIDSGISINSANILEPEKINVKRGIADTFGIVRLVGGLSTQAYDLNKRIIAEHRVAGAAANIKDRVLSIVDERFTTFVGAKMHVKTVAEKVGRELLLFGQKLLVRDISDIPSPGELITVNSSELGLTNQKFVVEEIGIEVMPGQDGAEYITMTLGQTEQQEMEMLQLLREIFESEKRKKLDADADTSQKFFSIPVTNKYTVVVTLTARNPNTNPYLWSDGGVDSPDDFEWGFWAWGDGN